MATYLRLNSADNAYLAPAYGWPFRLGYTSELEARGVITKRIASVTATVKADYRADVHLALYSAPLTVNGNDSELIAQTDAVGVMASTQGITVSAPTGDLAGSKISPAGTITISAASTAVTGSGTSFPLDGSWNGYELQVKNGAWYQIASVTSATALTLTGPSGRIAAGSGAFYVRRPSPAAFVVRLWVDNIQGGTQETIARDGSITNVPGQPLVPGGVTISSLVFA